MIVQLREGSRGITVVDGFYSVSSELLEWLSSRSISYRYSPIVEMGSGRDSVGYSFEFADDRSAMLFKLTWA
jgi:hypothetical protein